MTCMNRARGWHSKETCLRCLRDEVDGMNQRLEELEAIVVQVRQAIEAADRAEALR